LPAGIATIREGIARYRRTAAELQSEKFCALLGRFLADAGEIHQGLAVVEGALKSSRKSGAVYYEAELLRIQGLLLAKKKGSEQEAMDRLIEACAVADGQQAKPLLLRAWVARYQFTQSSGAPVLQGQALEERRGLEAVYQSFTEGQGTCDLVEAKQLLGLNS
jgi:predicted ATPase